MLLALKQKLFGIGTSSKDHARSRLHFVLVQDRTGLTSEQMAKFKQEMVDVIQKYFEIDKNAFDIAYKRDSDTTTLLINSPVVVKRLSAVRGNKSNNNNQNKTKDRTDPVAST